MTQLLPILYTAHQSAPPYFLGLTLGVKGDRCTRLRTGYPRIGLICFLLRLFTSAAHKFGYQSYQSRDDSRNCWWVALLSFGEGWHNNHHALPRSAQHGLSWWEFDMNWLAIRGLEALGLIWSVRASEHLRRARGHIILAV